MKNRDEFIKKDDLYENKRKKTKYIVKFICFIIVALVLYISYKVK